MTETMQLTGTECVLILGFWFFYFMHYYLSKILQFYCRVPGMRSGLKRIYHGTKWYLSARHLSDLTDVLGLLRPVTDRPDFSGHHVDIIVPIYNGYEFLKPLLSSLLDNSDIPFALILIDDKSTDARVNPLLEQYASRYPHITLLSNSENLGFVKTVNRGLQTTRHDVVVVNSDVVVPKGWLSRLMAPLFESEYIASATPLSNSSTLSSFPDISKSNALYPAACATVDMAFRRIQSHRDLYIQTPTGHGFCMALSRRAIDAVGGFDEVSFGKGYGEENDWCMKARARGYTHVIVPNLFCYHAHTGSFTVSQRQAALVRHKRTLYLRHPTYRFLVWKTVHDRHYQNLRHVLHLLWWNELAQKTVLCFSNTLSGGSMYANRDFIEACRKAPNTLVINIQSAYRMNRCRCHVYYHGQTFSFCLTGFHGIQQILSLFKLDEVVIHQLFGYLKLEVLLESISDARRVQGFRLKMDIRDFFAVCPTVQLMDYTGRFCHGCDDTVSCLTCLPQQTGLAYRGVDVPQWRRMWGRFFESVDELWVYSDYTREIILKIFGDSGCADKIHIGRIPINYVRVISPPPKSVEAPVHIGVTGNILAHKGGHLLVEMARMMGHTPYKRQVRLTVFGRIDPCFAHANIHCAGSYQRNRLADLMESQAIDILFIPSIWGETFCRTAQEGIQMGLPVACFNLGAPARRVRDYDRGLVIDRIDARCALEQIIDHVRSLRQKTTQAARSDSAMHTAGL